MSRLPKQIMTVPPLSLRSIERRATEVRKWLHSLVQVSSPTLPWDLLIDRYLPQAGLLFYPASTAELKDREAATDPSGTGAIHILIRAELYESLTDIGPGGNQARATVAHELGHAILHVPYLRKQRERERCLSVLPSYQLASSCDPEWQAWAFAGYLLIPKVSYLYLSKRLSEVAQSHGVSVAFVRMHLNLMSPLEKKQISLSNPPHHLLAKVPQTAIAQARRTR